MVGNLATETVLDELKALGADLPELTPLDGLLSASKEIGQRYGVRPQ